MFQQYAVTNNIFACKICMKVRYSLSFLVMYIAWKATAMTLKTFVHATACRSLLLHTIKSCLGSNMLCDSKVMA